MPKRVTVTEAEGMMHNYLKEMKREYTKMRDIAQKRIKRLGASMFSESKTYQRNAKGFAKLRDLDMRDFAKAYSELSKFVTAKGSTVSGQRSIMEKTIRKWRGQGLDLDEENYFTVMDIMEEMRNQKIVYGSDKAVELADTMLELNDQQRNEWLDNLETLLKNTDRLKMIPVPELQGYSFDEIKKMIGE